MKKIWKFGATAGLAAVLMAGCGDTATPVEEEDVETPAEPPTEVADVEFPVTMTDAVGEEVVIEEEPEAIVSMVPSNTEIVYELGAGDKMVGVSDFDNFPEEATEVEKIGGQEFNVEKIISLQPDLVLAHESGLGVGDAGLQQLRDAGLDVFVVNNAISFEEVYDSITVIAQATGTMETAESIVSEMEVQVAEIEELANTIEEPKTVFLEVGSQPDIYTTGKGTFMDEMLTLINAENVAGDLEGWVSMDPEAIVTADPDVIISTEGAYVEDAVEQIKSRSGFAEVTAVKEDAVYNLDSDMLTRSGPRLSEGLMEMAQAVYPEVFND
ncbi:ABC transporter substrate-binding protein [Planococcus donghaensis]|uniref:ABC transporter substrate-binding protein n=1 Tax=Planococcus donghaensis TaxID=414778 RepID=UPI003735DA1C